MKIIILFFVLIFFINPAFCSVSDYIDAVTNDYGSVSYSIFKSVLKGETSISNLQKQLIIDSEISKELETNFVYTDLESCIKTALQQNFNIKIQDAYFDESYWLYRNSQFQLLPDLYYNFDISNLQGQYLVGGIVATTTHEIPIQSLAIMQWSTINQGKYFFLIAQTKNTLKAEKALLEFTKEEIIRDTVIAYYDALEKKLEVEVQKMNIFERLEQLRYTQGRFQAGIGTLYDVKRAQAELAGAQQDYTNTLNSLRLRIAVLANIIGVDVLDVLYPFEIDVDSRVLVNPNESIENLYNHAIRSREDLKAKEAEVNAYRAIRSSNYTDIIPEVVISYQNGLVGTKRRGMTGHNSINLDIRAHVGKNALMGTITKIKADSAVVKAKKLELINMQRNVKEKIITYYYDSLNALKMIEASKIETEAADISLELSLANMKAGEATFIDVIASQNLKVQANINLIKNMIEYNRAQTRLLFEIGLLSPKNVLKDYKSRFFIES